MRSAQQGVPHPLACTTTSVGMVPVQDAVHQCTPFHILRVPEIQPYILITTTHVVHSPNPNFPAILTGEGRWSSLPMVGDSTRSSQVLENGSAAIQNQKLRDLQIGIPRVGISCQKRKENRAMFISSDAYFRRA
jgi:hypothetical protein